MDSAIAASGRNTDTVGGSFISLGQKVGKFGALAAGAVVTGIGAAAVAVTAFGVAGTKAAISYESAFTGVLKTTDGLVDSTGKLNRVGEELRQGFIDLSKEIPVTPEALARIGELGGQLGIGKENLLGFTRTMADLGVTTNLTTEEAATQFARLANIMQTPQDQFANLGSATVALGNNFATTESEIVNFAERIAGAGQISGLTEADVLAIGAAMSSVGIEAEAGGTAVQKVLLAMSEAVQGSGVAFTDNTKAIDQNVEQLLKLNAESARLEATLPGIQAELLAQFDAFTAAGGSAEEFGRQLGDKARQKAFLTALQIRELTDDTATLRAEQGKPIQTGALTTFAQVAGVTAEEFKRLWQEDAGQAFQLFVEGLGAQGDTAFQTLEKLELGDQRLIRSFLSLSNAGDLLANTLDLSSTAFAENTALTREAELRYATTESKLILLKNSFHATAIAVGDALLPAFNILIDQVQKLAGDGSILLPIFQNLGAWLAVNLPIAIETAMGFWNDTLLPGLQAAGQFIQTDVIPAVQSLVTWFSGFGDTVQQVASVVGPFIAEHAEGLKGALIAIGAVLAGAAIAAGIVAIGSAIAALASPIGIIVIAAGTLGAAWAENWGDIRGKTQAVVAFITPHLENLRAWLAVNLPIAIETAKRFWTDTLLPAIRNVVTFVQTDVIPAVARIAEWLEVNIPIAIQKLSDFWNNVLLPAFQEISEFITDFLIPAFQEVAAFIEDPVIPLLAAIGDLINSVVLVAVEALAGAWQNILLPAIEAVGGFLADTFIPIFEKLDEKFNLSKNATKSYEDAIDKLRKTFEKIRNILGGLTSKIETFTAKIKDFKLPDILTPGSPTPFEIALRGIADAMEQVNKSAVGLAGLGEVLGENLLPGATSSKSFLKTIENLLGRAGTLAKLGSGLAAVFERQTVKPLEEEMKRLGDVVGGREKILADLLGVKPDEISGLLPQLSLQAARAQQQINAIANAEAAVARARQTIQSFFGMSIEELAQQAGGFDSLLGVPEVQDFLAATRALQEAQQSTFNTGIFAGNQQAINALNGLTAAQNNLGQATESYRREQEKLLSLEQKRQDLAFLQTQLDLIEFVREKALDKSILEGITFGLDADAAGLLEAMTRATTALIDRASENLGIASPSTVFARMGQQISAGLAAGITSGAAMVNRAIEAAIPRPQVAAPVAAPAAGLQTTNTFHLGGNTINSGLDAATLDARITRAVARAL